MERGVKERLNHGSAEEDEGSSIFLGSQLGGMNLNPRGPTMGQPDCAPFPAATSEPAYMTGIKTNTACSPLSPLSMLLTLCLAQRPAADLDNLPWVNRSELSVQLEFEVWKGGKVLTRCTYSDGVNSVTRSYSTTWWSTFTCRVLHRKGLTGCETGDALPNIVDSGRGLGSCSLSISWL